jgi:hypothetical protein
VNRARQVQKGHKIKVTRQKLLLLYFYLFPFVFCLSLESSGLQTFNLPAQLVVDLGKDHEVLELKQVGVLVRLGLYGGTVTEE